MYNAFSWVVQCAHIGQDAFMVHLKSSNQISAAYKLMWFWKVQHAYMQPLKVEKFFKTNLPWKVFVFDEVKTWHADKSIRLWSDTMVDGKSVFGIRYSYLYTYVQRMYGVKCLMLQHNVSISDSILDAVWWMRYACVTNKQSHWAWIIFYSPLTGR